MLSSPLEGTKLPSKMMIALLAFTLLHLSSGKYNRYDAKYHISEHGAEYDETIEYDPTTNAVTYQVPKKHHDVVASTVIIHKPSVCINNSMDPTLTSFIKILS